MSNYALPLKVPYVFALGLTWLLAAPLSWAGVITPDSIPSPPALTTPPVQGTLVPAGGMVTDQYNSVGLMFAGVALTDINGVKAWSPLDQIVNGTTLDFSNKSGILAGLVIPGTQTLAKTDFLQVTLTNVAPHGAEMVVLGTHGLIGIEGSYPNASGQATMAWQGTDISFFGVGLWPRLASEQAPWGIASIEIGNLQPVHFDTPEPSTLLLTGLAACAGIAGHVWRRKGMTSNKSPHCNS
jgi:hypothetical protein